MPPFSNRVAARYASHGLRITVVRQKPTGYLAEKVVPRLAQRLRPRSIQDSAYYLGYLKLPVTVAIQEAQLGAFPRGATCRAPQWNMNAIGQTPPMVTRTCWWIRAGTSSALGEFGQTLVINYFGSSVGDPGAVSRNIGFVRSLLLLGLWGALGGAPPCTDAMCQRI